MKTEITFMFRKTIFMLYRAFLDFCRRFGEEEQIETPYSPNTVSVQIRYRILGCWISEKKYFITMVHVKPAWEVIESMSKNNE